MALGRPISLTGNIASKTIRVIATEGQTVFTVTGGYHINQIGVFRNGVRLSNNSDFTALDGATVTLSYAASVGDEVLFEINEDFRVADAIVSAASTQTIQGDLTVTGNLYSSSLTNGVTSINAGENISVNANTGDVTITGLANTTNIVAETIVTSGIVTASSFSGDGSGLTGVSAGSSVVNDNSTDDTYYVLFTKSTSGILTTANVSTSKLTFNPSTGTLSPNSISVAPQVLTFSPADGASAVANDTTIVLTFDILINKGSGNITLRDGSASGSAIETFNVNDAAVVLSGSQATITPSSDLPSGKDIYVVVDEGAFTSVNYGTGNPLLNTYNFQVIGVNPTTFNPADGATSVVPFDNIVITFNENVAKGTGNITLRAGSGIGTVRQTIDVTSSDVTISGAQVTIDPPSTMTENEDTYVVVDAGAFTNSGGESGSGNPIINTYNFTTGSVLGASYEGGNLICQAGGTRWIAAPFATEVQRCWDCRNDAVTVANAAQACGDWFIPTCDQFINPLQQCQTYLDGCQGGNVRYITNSEAPNYSNTTFYFDTFQPGQGGGFQFETSSNTYWIRTLRSVTY